MGTGPTVINTPTSIVDALKIAAQVMFPPFALINAALSGEVIAYDERTYLRI